MEAGQHSQVLYSMFPLSYSVSNDPIGRGTGSEAIDPLPVCCPQRSLDFAPQQGTRGFPDEKISLANFSSHGSLLVRAEVRPRLKGEPKWPGKHRGSSKCRAAWKSTCM
jgi:hypothetical protein